ncbi:pyridoxal phosphate-dependent aminotransferase [Aestuariivita boseongensis]|uniref:pyridoxal phosphate-dependent aminotransferase n=1 Tax=Aestuariivita boseongensis TaxID=1470562 RepID=UPI000682A7FB|nr:pyridoxal phosphate-dependent aminotransferase [Aestuariivita boseongensis]
MNMQSEQTALITARSHHLAMSPIKEMSILSARVPGAASLAWGPPSFPTPDHIRKSIEREPQRDPSFGMYALPAGLPELRKAVAVEHQRRTGVTVDPEQDVTIAAGNMEGLNSLFQVLVEAGDEVIVTDPGFVSHISQIEFCGGTPVFWPMQESEGWELNVDALEPLFGPRAKAVVLVSPSNPSGRILREDPLRRTAQIAPRRGVLINIDDPYSVFTYENRARSFNLASALEYCGNLVFLFTFSKAYAMSGWRVGYIIAPKTIRDEVVKVHGLTMICTPWISQVAALTALLENPSPLQDFERTSDRRRELTCDRLDAVPHIFDYARSEGAYSVFPCLLGQCTEDVGFSHDLLQLARVAVTPGSAFCPSGKGHVRMAYCVNDDIINLAFDRSEKQFGCAAQI